MQGERHQPSGNPNSGQPEPAPGDIAAGALNLLRNCVSVKGGERVLIVGEEGPSAYFDSAVCGAVADVARDLGAEPRVVMAPDVEGPEGFPGAVSDAMASVDHTIFFARLGDRVRFCELPGGGTKTMCYTRDLGYLGADFGRVPYGLYAQVLERLMAAMGAASHYRITCPLGSDLQADVAAAGADDDLVSADFTVRLFPIMIFPPVSCASMTGRLALGDWLTSTATHAYDGSLFTVDPGLFALVDGGRIVDLEGPQGQVARVREHFERVGAMVGGDPYAMNSWHTGIYPKTYFCGTASDDIENWGDVVYGSPRFTHFHACGADPGDICISMFDATITFDGEPFWDAGRFSFLDRDDLQQLKSAHPGADAAYDMRWDIGI